MTETCQNCHTPHESGQMTAVETKDGEIVKLCSHCIENDTHGGKIVVPQETKKKTKKQLAAEVAAAKEAEEQKKLDAQQGAPADPVPADGTEKTEQEKPVTDETKPADAGNKIEDKPVTKTAAKKKTVKSNKKA